MTIPFDPSIFPARWEEHHARQALTAWRESKLTIRAFGRLHRVQQKRLVRWFRRLGAIAAPARRASRSRPSPPSFVELVVPEPVRPAQQDPFAIEFDGVTVRVPPIFEADALSELLAVLRC
ncbi:MAG: hypothetical protein GY898_15650 [Proteobacteria bacterium]|nr:hypothetical protein [Pseudomonadota bacterium]